jgi:hypothetical protein
MEIDFYLDTHRHWLPILLSRLESPLGHGLNSLSIESKSRRIATMVIKIKVSVRRTGHRGDPRSRLTSMKPERLGLKQQTSLTQLECAGDDDNEKTRRNA